MNDKQALKIFESCVDEMYRMSTPPASWKDIKEKYSNKNRSEFYSKHRISEQDYNDIKSKYAKQLNSFYKRRLVWFLLDYAPCFKKKGD